MRKITITVDDVTLDCLRYLREQDGIPYSVAIRRAVWLLYQEKCIIMPDSFSSSVAPLSGAGAAAPDLRKDAPAPLD